MEKFKYCHECGTISFVYFSELGFMPKLCRCRAEKMGETWIDDDEFKREIFEE